MALAAFVDRSETVAELFTALVDAVSNIPPITKAHTAHTGTYGYTYADLSDVTHAIRPALTASGLVVVQSATVTADGGWIAVHTTIAHRSGEYVTLAPTMLATGTTAQANGSAITYARRYSLLAALGLATDDDDGIAATPARDSRPRPREAGAGSHTPPRSEASANHPIYHEPDPAGGMPRPAPSASGDKPATEKQRRYIVALAAGAGIPDYVVPDELSAAEASEIIEGLKAQAGTA